MSSLINDGSLIGFWPLNEPSGVPLFKNYSPTTGRHPSGLCFDMQVAVADIPNHDEMASPWPGTDRVFNSESGVFVEGYRVQGTWAKDSSDSAPWSRHLLVGAGGRTQQEQFLVPPTAQSGFTAGGWIYPDTDGYFDLDNTNDLNLAQYGWIHGITRAHGLFGLFRGGTSNGGWRIGVSGLRSNGAQFNTEFTAGRQLRAFVGLEGVGVAMDYLEVPVEAHRATHIGFTYRYINGTSNEFVLYKDGRVAASGTTSNDIVLNNTALRSTSLAMPFGIGHSNELTTDTTDFQYTSGWGNLVSGVYFFRRVLHEGEMMDLHDAGGLQPEESALLPTKEVTIEDPLLLGYYPYLEPGFGDASKNHRPLIANEDMGDLSFRAVVPGPHGGGGGINNSSANANAMAVANSGLCFDIINGRSWTIGGWFAPESSIEREDNMMMSWGSVTTQTNASLLPIAAAPSTNSMGFVITCSGVTNRQEIVAEVYPLGDVTSIENLVLKSESNLEYYSYAATHIALAYDDQTRGVALYANGALQSSGTLADSLTDQLERIAGSGYPLMFTNGITNAIPDTSARGVHLDGGRDMWFGPQFVYGRALLPREVRAIATSGIDLIRLSQTRQDTRLVGYWPAGDFKIDDIVVEDQAMVWGTVPAHLSRGDAFGKQERWYDRDHNEAAGTIFAPDATARYNQFGTRTLPPELASEGNLGMTSGAFTVYTGTANIADALDARSAIGNVATRFKPTMEERDASSQNVLGEYIVSYEVTPSGNIPATLLGATSFAARQMHNSALHGYGNIGTANDEGEVRSFLTTIDASAGSGVTLVVLGHQTSFTAANIKPLVSGSVTYGVPNRVLIHGKFEEPHAVPGITAGTTPYSVSLWINGVRVQRNIYTSNTAFMWSNGTPDSNADQWFFRIGGIIGDDDAHSTQLTMDSGLGEIYMRNVFLMRGAFRNGEIESLAASGIRDTSFDGFSNQPTKTQVSLANSALQAYYRFNGFAGGPAHGVQGSGTTDLSFNLNHLLPLAEIRAQRGDATQAAIRLRAIPGPFEASDLGVQASGFTYSSLLSTNSAIHRVAPFMASGTGFNSPQDGFSVGFHYIKKGAVQTNTFDAIVAYGLIRNTALSSALDENTGWIIGQDGTENLKMIISTGGNMYLNNTLNAAQSGQVVCGSIGEAGSIYEDIRRFQQYDRGNIRVPRLDQWAHYCWTYDPTALEVRAYVNGGLVDVQPMKVDPEKWSGPQVPANPAARYLTFLQHTHTTPWNFDTLNINDYDGVPTDFFYFNETLTPAQVLYIAENGIDSAVGTEGSGIIGGFVHGQDTGSGIVGGYQQGQDVGSGMVGGYFPGSIQSSGAVGGYVSGVVFGDGTIGGWVQGLDIMSGIIGGHIHGLDIGSGIIAGYIQGQTVVSGLLGGLMFGATQASGMPGGFMLGSALSSGIVGGYIIGGLQGLVEIDGNYTVEVMTAQDFDAQLQVLKTANSDFDARVVIFQEEIGPLVNITIPAATVSGQAPPFNQYFIAKASGQQGKTITSTKWTFGDLTPAVSVAESGAGCYPVQHRYATSGFYIAKFEAVDSAGQHGSDTVLIHAASGIDPVLISLSGVPRSGNAALVIDFTTTVDILPPGVSVITSLLDYDDGQTTSAFNPTHTYSEPGVYHPIWCVRDSRGFLWCDSLEAGNDLTQSGGG